MTELARFGHWLRRRQDVVNRVQWAVVAVYAVLLVLPVMLPSASGLARLAEGVFWGIWWPAVILATLLFGQFWCGLLCPDGTLTEFASRRGRGLKVPAWMRWPGWPLVGFSVLSLIEVVVDARYTARGALLAIGGTSLIAVAVGVLFGRGKRVWCRYLCPAGSLFSLLARASVLQFHVDRAAWDAAPRPVPKPVDCPLLLDVRRLTSNEKCNMCGRCSGHRDAVVLASRPPGSEIAALTTGEARLWESLGICFLLVGLTYAVAHGRGAPLVEIAAVAAMLGGAVALALLGAALGRMTVAVRLAYGLIPLAGLGLFAGAVEHSLAVLADAGVDVAGTLPWLRMAILVPGGAWSVRLERRLIASLDLPPLRRRVALLITLVTVAALAWRFQCAPF